MEIPIELFIILVIMSSILTLGALIFIVSMIAFNIYEKVNKRRIEKAREEYKDTPYEINIGEGE